MLCSSAACSYASQPTHSDPQRRDDDVADDATSRGKNGLDAIDELPPRSGGAGAVDLPKGVRRAPRGTVNDTLLAEIEEANKGFRVEAPQVDEREDVDISDVNPIQSVLSGVAALATAYVFWLAVGFAANSFAEHPVDSDIYAIQRISTVMRTVVLGLGTLLTGMRPSRA